MDRPICYSNAREEKSPRSESAVVKREPAEAMMPSTGHRDFAVDMSVMTRTSPPNRYMHDRNTIGSQDVSNNAYNIPAAALYANKHLMNSQALLGHSHMYNQIHSHQPESPHSISVLSPPSRHQQHHYRPHHQDQSPPHPIVPIPTSTSPTKTLQATSEEHCLSLSPTEDINRESSSFKMKDSSGKLALIDALSSGSNSSMDLDFLPLSNHQRAKREFVPDNRKDEGYWSKRLKNNDSARRSRVKRKALEQLMESRLMDLQKENIELRHEMQALRRRFGVPDEPSTTKTPELSQDLSMSMSSEFSASLSRDDELEQQSAGSDDSHSYDDARTFNVSSMSALSRSLGPTASARDRADSLSSGISSGDRSSRPESCSSQQDNFPFLVRTDKTGALDLTSESGSSSGSGSNRSTPPVDSPMTEARTSPNSLKRDRNSPNSAGSASDMDTEEKMSSKEMRGFPLKCRWKRDMLSSSIASSTPTPPPSNHD